MDKRIRSPNYPALSLPDAIDKVAALYRAQHTHSAPREVIAKGMGYNSLNGASASAISALQKFGLLLRTGDEIKVSDRALRILHPHSIEERNAAIQEAASEPPLFTELNERFPERMPSDDLLRNYLIRNGFAPSAVSSVIMAYRETSEMVEREGRAHDSPREQTREHDDMPSPQERHTEAHRESTTAPESTPPSTSTEPYRVSITPSGIEASGKLTNRASADEFIAAIQALKLLLKSEEAQRPEPQHDKQSETESSANVSLMITHEQKAALLKRGYTEEQIRDMKPEDAHRTLGLIN